MVISSDLYSQGGRIHQHKIRSFTRRTTRITVAQKEALNRLWPSYGIAYSGERIPVTACFNRDAPLIVDIGPGNGDATIQHARYHPENNYIAIEVHPASIGQLLRKIEGFSLNNIRIISGDAFDVLSKFGVESIDEVFIFFPDPWPKKRHHKRRLLQTAFINHISTALKLHGRLFIATDWEHYATHILTLCDNNAQLINLAGNGKL